MPLTKYGHSQEDIADYLALYYSIMSRIVNDKY